MSIVLNETEWAKGMISQRSLGKKPFETLSRVAKYYIDCGYDRNESRKMLDTFIIQCDPTASLPKWSETLDFALKRALKYKSIYIEGIDISKAEMEKIDKLDGVQIKRLAFTLLCLSKYWRMVNPACDYWVNNKDSDIMKMANINTSIKRQSMMYHSLNKSGMIQFSKKVDNTSVRVCFVEDGEIAITVTDFRNLGYQYLKYHGEPYMECENCGLVVKMNSVGKDGNIRPGRSQKYCKDCAAQIKIQQSVNSVMRRRMRSANVAGQYSQPAV